jgi:hypothetical protein
MWTKWARSQAEWAQGPVGSTPWLVGQGLRRFGPSQVSGGRSTQLAGHVAWPPGLHLVPNRHIQVGGGLIHPYKYSPHGKS